MKILVLGATGATGRLVVDQLLQAGQEVRVIVRSLKGLPASICEHSNLFALEANLLDLPTWELSNQIADCSAVVSCLGHRLSFQGIFGHPRRLVTEATRRLCLAIESQPSEERMKFVLMNTTGNRNGDLDEQISLAQRFVIGLLRWCVPPHADNEEAADYLRVKIGQNHEKIEWVAIRPDGLVDDDAVSAYEIHPSPTRSAIFDSGKTSRINVGHFMKELILDPAVWNRWKGQMPVIYNQGPPPG